MAQTGGRRTRGTGPRTAGNPTSTNGKSAPASRGTDADVITLWRDTAPAPDLEDVRATLERKLAWYGLRWVGLGRFHWRGDGALFVELVDRDGGILDRVEVDRLSATFRPSRGQASRLVSEPSVPAGSPSRWGGASAA